MKFKKTSRGYYAVLSGSKNIKLGTHDLDEAKALAKAANLDGLDIAHRAGLLTAQTVQRLTMGKVVTARAALAAYREYLTRSELSDLTSHMYALRVESFLDKRMDMPMSAFTEAIVYAFVNPKSPIVVGTRNNRRNALLHFFNYCAARGFTLGNPAELVSVQTHTLSHKQMEPTLKKPVFYVDMKVLPDFWRVAAKMAMTFGLRLSDVAGLEWASFSEPGKLVVWTDKTRTRIQFDVPPEIQEEINVLPKRDPELLFPDQWEIAQSPTKRALLSVQFKRLTGVGFHQLRAGFATRLAQEGESLLSIQRRLGHASPEMTKHYIRP
jgi:integrase